MTSATTRHLTPYGEASISWAQTATELTVDLVIPFGTSAELDLPGRPLTTHGHGRHHITV